MVGGEEDKLLVAAAAQGATHTLWGCEAAPSHSAGCASVSLSSLFDSFMVEKAPCFPQDCQLCHMPVTAVSGSFLETEILALFLGRSQR